MVRVLLFGSFADRAGWASKDVDAATLGELKDRLSAGDDRFGDWLNRPSTHVILNAEIRPSSRLPDDHPLDVGDEVGFGPPVSGG